MGLGLQSSGFYKAPNNDRASKLQATTPPTSKRPGSKPIRGKLTSPTSSGCLLIGSDFHSLQGCLHPGLVTYCTATCSKQGLAVSAVFVLFGSSLFLAWVVVLGFSFY